MSPLELMLSRAGADVAWPETPDLASAVRLRLWDAADSPSALSGSPVRRDHRRIPSLLGRVRRPAVVALVALLLLAASAAAVPGIREPILDWLGIRGEKIERVPRLPLPPGAGKELRLGRHTTLAAAGKRLPFRPLLPSGLGPPSVWFDTAIPGGQLGLVYSGGKLFITEVEGHVRSEYARKFVTPGTRVEPVRVNGERGLWFEGVHEFVYEDANGSLRPDSARLAGNTLLWLHGDVLLRLEGAHSKAQALMIASSVREAP